MSVRVLSKVFTYSKARQGQRLVMFALADSASDDGVTWVSQEDLARKTLLSMTQTQDCLYRLRESGAIEVRKAQRGRRRINVYRLVLPDLPEVEYDRLPFELSEPFSRHPESGPRDDLTTPGIDNRRHPESGVFSSAPPLIEVEPLEVLPVKGAAERPPNRPVTVGRRKVSDKEYQLAVAVLDVYNRVSNARPPYTGKGWIELLVRRIREHPDLTIADHAGVIEASFLRPWWKDDPDPRVIYGNERLFDSRLRSAIANPAGAAPGGRALTPDEVAAYGIEWGPGTEHESLAAARSAPGFDFDVHPDDVREDG